jgi:hypothetical protein
MATNTAERAVKLVAVRTSARSHNGAWTTDQPANGRLLGPAPALSARDQNCRDERDI